MTDKCIAVTGSGGFLGRTLIKHIIEQTNWSVVAFSSGNISDREALPRVQYIMNDKMEDFLRGNNVDVLVHLAFSRRFDTVNRIANSLNFSEKVYKAAYKYGVQSVINISTQGVYAQSEDFKDESALISPDSFYTMAKYASEVLLNSVFECDRRITHLRLDSIAQSQRVLPGFIEQAKNNRTIKIVGGKQYFSYIDVNDAADAIISMIRCEQKWQPVYNVGLNKTRYSIMELAEHVVSCASKFGLGEVAICLEKTDTLLYAGLDSHRFIIDTGWQPGFSIQKTIENMFVENI